MQICELLKCTGCAACVNVCSKNAVSLVEKLHGFAYPLVDTAKCVNCGLCIKTCPVNHASVGFQHKDVLAALVKDDAERLLSSSGGIFACLAKHVISNGGYVYGAALCKDLIVRHIEVNTLVGLDSLRNSKYVQSEIGLCYQQAKKRLLNGDLVLFSGTPCQIAGFRNYLGKSYKNLILIDLLCHGVPSPGMLRRYIKSEEEIAGSKMKDLQFRSKVVGWKKNFFIRTFENDRQAEWGDTFISGFLKNYYLRESCYSCVYATDIRQGDISLGDYWEYRESAPEYIEDDDKGISLVIINTEKGAEAFRSIHKALAYAKRTMEDAKRGNINLYKPSNKPELYEAFWGDAEVMEWNEMKHKYFTEQDSIDWMKKELRDYYSIPFKKRHWKHKLRRTLGRVYHKVIRN